MGQSFILWEVLIDQYLADDELPTQITVPSIPNFYSIEREINALSAIFSVNSPDI